MTELHKRSHAQEKRIAAGVGGVTQPRSGAGWDRKNDVRSDMLLVECKRTDHNKQITLQAVVLEDLDRNAAIVGKEPVLSFELKGRDYVIVSQSFFEELLQAWLISMDSRPGPSSSNPKRIVREPNPGRARASASTPPPSPSGSSSLRRTTPMRVASPSKPSASARARMTDGHAQ